MEIKLNKEKCLKKYRVNYFSKMNIEEEEQIEENFLDIEIGWNGDNVELYMKNSNKSEEESKMEKFLSMLDTPFEKIVYKLDENGKVQDILNYIEIVEKWENLKKILNFEPEDEEEEKKFFEYTGIVKDRLACTELVKRFFIIPYLFIGFYNQPLKKDRALTKDGILYNIYGIEDMNVRYDITDGSTDDEIKIIHLKGRDNPNYDRHSFIKMVHSNLSQIPLHKIGGFNLQILGEYRYSLDNILKMMDFNIKLDIKKLLEYEISFRVEGED